METTLNTSSLKITDKILGLIAEIDEYKGTWRAIGRIAPERFSSLRRVATIENVGSSTPFDTPRLMAELIAWTGESLDLGEIQPLLVTAIFVVVFLEIHPFQDGNGRLSRILTTLLLLRTGYAYVHLARHGAGRGTWYSLA